MEKVLVVDNYDSFTYNLVHLIEKSGEYNCTVQKNDRLVFSDINDFQKIILSPGPGLPDEAGELKKVIENFAHSKSILGVCLGHQAIAEVFGARLFNLDTVYHGVSSNMRILNKDGILFKGLDHIQPVGRYHSWMVSSSDFPETLTVTAVDDKDHIMAFSHKNFNVHGVQFHPESILTPCGEKIMQNWLCHT